MEIDLTIITISSIGRMDDQWPTLLGRDTIVNNHFFLAPLLMDPLVLVLT